MSGAPATSAQSFPTFESIGVRPIINCQGTYTAISGSLTLPEVKAAMEAAGSAYVQIDELKTAVGNRIGELMQCEFGMVTNGCAAALCHIAAALIAGTDKNKQALLPFVHDVEGVKNEIVVQKDHRFGYDFSFKMTGGKFVEVATAAEMRAAIGPKTCMLLFLGDAGDNGHPGQVGFEEMAEIANAASVPLVVDAAAERPDAPNFYLTRGAAIVCYSGGKVLRGPQSTGLALGSREILKAAIANQAPNSGFGRPMKVGKEEIMGALAAVEQWVKRDHDAEWIEFDRRLCVIQTAAEKFEGVTTRYVSNKQRKANVAPELHVAIDPDIFGDALALNQRLDAGTPRIRAFATAGELWFMPHMMEPGDAETVAEKLTELLTEAHAAIASQAQPAVAAARL